MTKIDILLYETKILSNILFTSIFNILISLSVSIFKDSVIIQPFIYKYLLSLKNAQKMI